MKMFTPVILCGGSGTRLWPLSRKNFAKQHVSIIGESSPFQDTLRRVSELPGSQRPLVVTSSDGRFLVSDQAAATGVAVDIVIEPEGRDTLAAIAAATEILSRRDPEAIALVLPSDHLIPDLDGFAATIDRALSAAEDDALVILGLTPSSPSTAYGYIRAGDVLASGARQVVAFEEKPDAKRAATLISEGCLWNSGMFCFRVDVMRAELTEHAAEIAAKISESVDSASDDLGALVLGSAFASAQKQSFDYGVMEKTRRATVVIADFAWSDIGDWREVWAHSQKDEAGNALQGPALVRDARNCYVRADQRLVCAIGLDDVAIIDTPDAVLVTPLNRTQDIKNLVADLTAARRPEATTPARVHRPWGSYQTMDLGNRFRVKRIVVAPGKKLSLQMHHHRAEHWVVVRGTAEVVRNEETFLLHENESIYLPAGCRHRLGNPGKIPVELIEVQTGAYLEEDDIVRIDDDFGRL